MTARGKTRGLGVVGAGVVVLTIAAATPAAAEKPAPKPGTVIKVESCTKSPPPCYIIQHRIVAPPAEPVKASRAVAVPTAEPGKGSRTTVSPTAEPAGRVVYGCYGPGGTVTVTTSQGACGKREVPVTIVLPD
jgi:hypothetical protein